MKSYNFNDAGPLVIFRHVFVQDTKSSTRCFNPIEKIFNHKNSKVKRNHIISNQKSSNYIPVRLMTHDSSFEPPLSFLFYVSIFIFLKLALHLVVRIRTWDFSTPFMIILCLLFLLLVKQGKIV